MQSTPSALLRVAGAVQARPWKRASLCAAALWGMACDGLQAPSLPARNAGLSMHLGPAEQRRRASTMTWALSLAACTPGSPAEAGTLSVSDAASDNSEATFRTATGSGVAAKSDGTAGLASVAPPRSDAASSGMTDGEPRSQAMAIESDAAGAASAAGKDGSLGTDSAPHTPVLLREVLIWRPTPDYSCCCRNV